MNHGLYAIVDVGTLRARGANVTDFARRLLDAGALAAMQLRAKGRSAADTLALARALQPMCASAGVPFYVNDRADIALLAAATGVHVGQDDLPVDAVRRATPSLSVGLSTHTAAEFAAGVGTGAAYLAVGPVFETATKADAAPVVGLDALAARVRDAKGSPVVAIGGITLARAPLVREAGARAGAVIGALVVDDASVTSTARALHRALGGA